MPMLPNANWFDWHAAAPASNPALPSKGVPYATTPATIATATSTPPMDTTHKSIPSSKTINLSINKTTWSIKFQFIYSYLL